ncbi:MAG TPA: ROK family protein [Pyrinomonadaceae bacterium]|nr:ROK family protein [Pyrinomonadaceae bacterium]
MKKIVIAMDLGGTNMRFAAVRSNGEIVASLRSKTPGGDASVVFAAIVSGIAGVIQRSKVRKPLAISAAVPTTSTTPEGILSKLPNLPALDHFDLGGSLRNEFNVPVLVVNDATSATIGEHWLGASKYARTVIGITLGTGVGGGLIVDGKPHSGADGSAGEIGHFCVDPNGPMCGCGSNGCLEQYVSGTAIVRFAKDVGLSVGTSKDVFELAMSGNELAAGVFDHAGRHFGVALANLINILNPEKIVVGGGVAAGWRLLKPAVLAEVEKRAFAIPAERVTIVRAKLGDRAGVLGAARIAYLKSAEMEK